MLLSDPRTYQSSTESSEVAMEDIVALWECPGAPLEASDMAIQYTIAIQESLQASLEASEVTTEYTIAIPESRKAAARPPGEQGSPLRLHSLVPQVSSRVYTVHYTKSNSTTSGAFQGFRNQTIDFAEANFSVSRVVISNRM
ncbi:hypothetical protein BDD12DRAFT_888369 [Trichophaea hybrida]|nr:hypothetical protein BDD12DRAFT_888369 [Trichophaea hybrida]